VTYVISLRDNSQVAALRGSMDKVIRNKVHCMNDDGPNEVNMKVNREFNGKRWHSLNPSEFV